MTAPTNDREFIAWCLENPPWRFSMSSEVRARLILMAGVDDISQNAIALCDLATLRLDLAETRAQVAERDAKLDARAAELRTLPPNWDSYGAGPIAPAAIEAALALLRSTPQLTPCSNGGVQIDWPGGEISFLPTGEQDFGEDTPFPDERDATIQRLQANAALPADLAGNAFVATQSVGHSVSLPSAVAGQPPCGEPKRVHEWDGVYFCGSCDELLIADDQVYCHKCGIKLLCDHDKGFTEYCAPCGRTREVDEVRHR